MHQPKVVGNRLTGAWCLDQLRGSYEERRDLSVHATAARGDHRTGAKLLRILHARCLTRSTERSGTTTTQRSKRNRHRNGGAREAGGSTQIGGRMNKRFLFVGEQPSPTAY